MRDTDYTSLRREFLGVGLTGAMVGLAGCSDSVTVETGSDDDTEETDTESDDTTEESSNQSPNLESVDLSFSYSEPEQQVTIEFAGGADIQAGNVRIQQGSETQVSWNELGSTTAASDQNISPGATAVLGENILNWGQTVAEDDLIRVVYTGRDSPATLERYSPPESTDSESTVPASISGFTLESSGEQQLQVSFDSSKQLGTIEVAITGAESATLARTDFTEGASGNGTYTYSASYEASSDGSYSAEITQAADTDGTNALNGENISDTASINTESQPSDTTPPSISAFSIANPSGQKIRISFDSTEEIDTIRVAISGPETATLSTADFSQASTTGEQITYQAMYELGTDGVYTAEMIEATDTAGNNGATGAQVSVEVNTAPEATSNGLVAYWPLNDTSGNVVDDSGNGNNGDIVNVEQGEITEYSFGDGTAFDFSTTESGFVRIPSTDRMSGGQSATITATAWIRPISGSQIVSKKSNNSEGDWTLHITEEYMNQDDWNSYRRSNDDDPPYLRYWSERDFSPDTEIVSGGINWEEWQHVAFSLDQPNETVRLYIDGEMIFEATEVGGISANTDSAVEIGGMVYPDDRDDRPDYDGAISDVRVYDRVLSETEINTISQADDRR